jgi:hypothetical protein
VDTVFCIIINSKLGNFLKIYKWNYYSVKTINSNVKIKDGNVFFGYIVGSKIEIFINFINIYFILLNK